MFQPSFFLLLICALTVPNFAKADHNVLTPPEQAAGWKLLFDGKSAPGLRGLQKPDFLKSGWKIKNGALVLPKSVRESGNQTGGDLVTAEQFGDFEFHFDFKFTASAQAGILYFARGGVGLKPTGHEYQIIDDIHHPDGLKGGPLHRTAALYAVLPPAENKRLKESDEWNTGAIVVRGNHVEHWLNGDKVLEYECNSAALAQAVKENKAQVPPGFGTKIKSSLAILDKGEEVSFRNLKIRPLSSTPAPPPPPLGAPAATPAPPSPAVAQATATPAPIRTTPAPATPAATPAKKPWVLPPPPPPPVLKP